eukprot:Platyproteum_vivax@DN12855_c0_g1_i1.p1
MWTELGEMPFEWKTRVWSIFEENQSCWLRPFSGQAKVPPAEFDVSGTPAREKGRHMFDLLKKELEVQVDSMLEKHIIETSNSPWSTVPVWVRKADETWQMCLDFRKLNTKMVFDAYRLPRIWEVLHKAASAK